MHWSCTCRNPIRNTWQYIKYLNVDFDSNGIFFEYFRERSTYFLKKKKKHLLRKISGCTCYGYIFYTKLISKICIMYKFVRSYIFETKGLKRKDSNHCNEGYSYVSYICSLIKVEL